MPSREDKRSGRKKKNNIIESAAGRAEQ